MKHEIEIEGLPEGWRAVAFRVPKIGEYAIVASEPLQINSQDLHPRLIIEKIKPRRIVLEETDQDAKGYIDDMNLILNDARITVHGDKIWREVKE